MMGRTFCISCNKDWTEAVSYKDGVMCIECVNKQKKKCLSMVIKIETNLDEVEEQLKRIESSLDRIKEKEQQLLLSDKQFVNTDEVLELIAEKLKLRIAYM